MNEVHPPRAVAIDPMIVAPLKIVGVTQAERYGEPT